VKPRERKRKRIQLQKKEDEINLFFDLKKKIALTPDNHQLLQVTGLNHPYTPNILFLSTLIVRLDEGKEEESQVTQEA